jgi:DNA repair protein RadC
MYLLTGFSFFTHRRYIMTPFMYSTEQEVIHAALQIMESKISTQAYFTAAVDTKHYFQLRLARSEREIFSVMFLNNQHQLIATEDLFFGTVDSATVYPREVLKAALRHNATAVVFGHNHPSGVAEPSRADKELTARLVEALHFVDVSVLDHIVVSESDTVSFAERGLL